MLGRLTAAHALLLLAACSDDVAGPATIEGDYALRQLNGAELPYDHEGLGCCIYLSGSLELHGGSYVASLTAENRNNGQVFTAREWGTYSRPASSGIAFAPDSFSISGLLLDLATVSGDSIRVAFGGEGPGSPDQFRALFVGGS
ncbi:MAG TPA: hypothetical protein VMN37_03655 [Gemmatimonadales bacterium]|nr:hypothetical protein [Gemmatimonadales bacterium]